MSRPFTAFEEERLIQNLQANGRVRDALLVEMGCFLGFRVSELLTLRVCDVADAGVVKAELVVARRHLKGGKGERRRSVCSRRAVVPQRIRQSLEGYLRTNMLLPGSYLFQSRKNGNSPISRVQAYRIVVAAAEEVGVVGRIGTHSARKRFIQRIYTLSGHDLIKTQRIVGHRSPLTTARYLETDQADLDALVLAQDATHDSPNSTVASPEAAAL